MKRKYRYITARILGFLTILLLSTMFVLQIPAVQTSLARFAADKLNGKIDGRINLSAIKIIPPGSLILKDLVILDNHPLAQPDTFFFAETISASLRWNWLFDDSGISFSKVTVRNGGMVLVSEPTQHLTNLSRIFGIVPPTVPAEPTPGTVFTIDRVRVEDFHFRLKNKRTESEFPVPYGLNFADLDLYTNVIGHDMHFTQGVMYATCDHGDIRVDDCNYFISSLTGNCRVGQGMTLVQNIHLIDNWSDFHLASYSMEYRKRHGIREFATQVKVGATFDKGHLAMESVKQFVHTFDGNPIDLDLTGGHVYGYLYDLGLNNLTFHDRYSGVSGIIDGRMTGLPDTERFGVSLRLIDFSGTAQGMGEFLSAFTPGSAPDLSGIAPGQTIHINAQASGLMNRMRAEMNVSLPSGSLQAKARVHNVLNKFKPTFIDGSITTDKLDIKRLSAGLPVGRMTLSSDFSASLIPGNPEFNLDTLSIERLELLNGSYRDIVAKAGLKDRNITLALDSADPNLDLVLNASAKTKENGGLKALKLNSDFNNIDLDSLGILNKVPLNGISTRIDVDMSENSRGILLGDVNIPDILLRTANGTVNTGKINLKARYGAQTQRINLTSGICDASYVGSDAIADFISNLKAITTDTALPALSGGGEKEPEDDGTGSYALSVNFHQFSDVLGTFVQGLQVADSTKFRLNIQDGRLRGTLASSSLAFKGIGARKVDLSFDNESKGLNAYILSNEVRLGKIKFRKSTTSLAARDNRIDLRLRYDNSDSRGTETADLNIDCNLSRDKNDTLNVIVQPYRSFFNFDGRRWDLNGMAALHGRNVKVNDMTISSGKHNIGISGGIGKGWRDTLMISASDFELAFLDKLMGLDINAAGKLNGHAMVSLPLDRSEDLDIRMKLDDASVGDAPLGNFALDGNWDNESGTVLASLSNTNSGNKSISARANLTPKTGKLNGHVKLDRMKLAVLKPFLGKILTDIGGYANGEFLLDGNNGAINISEKGACLQDAMIKVAYTGVTYIINGDLDVDSRSITMNNLSVRDMFDGTGDLNGKIRFGEKGLELNVGLGFNNMKLLDIPQKSTVPVYGNIVADGSVGVAGTPGNLKVSADLNANRRSDIHIPMNTALVSSTSDLLTFVSQIEYGREEHVAAKEKKLLENKSRLEIDGHLSISPELTAWVEIDKTTGNKMTLRGDGELDVQLNPSTDKANLNGVYVIQEGDYHFVVPGLLEKDFNIKQGSSVTLTGNVSDTRLDIRAGHPVRASISTLLADSTAVGNRQAVECIIGINGDLKTPKLAFDIDIPNVDPTTRAQVESALNTEDKRQKQFMSLLVLGSFLPAEESGVVNGTNMLFSNVGEIMSGQINSIMQKLEIPVDFGFDYQQNLSGGNMYDVAISTQLFNNRVIVNGSVGSRQNGGSTSRSDVVGDIDVSVKLDKEGKWRANVFSHSANEYTSFLDNSQRSGIGFSYQKEFSRLKELFTSKKNLESLPPQEQGKVIIKVE